jgi:DNA repair exonuclease SbcCD ATPase subunit
MANNVNMTVNISANSSGLLTGLSNAQNAVNRAQQNMNRSAQQNATNQNRQQSRQGGNAAYATMQAAQTLDDLQYGIRGVVNNIPMLLQSLGMGMGLAAVLSILAVVLNVVIQNWDKLSGNSKKAAQDNLMSANTIANAADRVKQAKYNLEVQERALTEAHRKEGDSIKDIAHSYEMEMIAIQATEDAMSRRLSFVRELEEAHRDLALAQIEAGAGSEAQKLEARQSLESSHAEKMSKFSEEELTIRQKSLEDQLKTQNEIASTAIDNAEKEVKLQNEKLILAEEIARLEKNTSEEAQKRRARDIYGKILERSPNGAADGDFKPAERTAAEIRAEAERLTGERITDDTTTMYLKTLWAYGKMASDMFFLGGSSGIPFPSLGPKELGATGPSAYNLRIAEEQVQAELEAAKLREKDIDQQHDLVSGSKEKMENAEKEMDAIKRKLEAIKEEKKHNAEMLEDQKKTLAIKQGQERSDMMKSAIAAAMKDTSPIVDSITKIGGGGFIGSPESTNPMEKALREYKKQVTELKKSNDLLQQIRDKYPSFQP